MLLAGRAREHGVNVVLTGEGADEIFGGYDIFKEAKIRRFWARFPDSSRRASLVRRLYPYLPNLHRQPASYLQAFFHAAPGDLASPWFSHLPRWRMTSRLKLFLSDEMRAGAADFDGFADLGAALPAAYADWDPLSQGQYLETTQLLPGYLLSSQGDRMAMAHGVEGRYPFLDPAVVSFASSLRPSLRMKVLREKYLLKRLAADLVPSSVRQRTKQPYRAPAARAFFGPSQPGYVADLLAPDQVKRDGIFKPDAVSRLTRKFQEGRAIGIKDEMALVGILSTQLLVDRFINNPPPLATASGELRRDLAEAQSAKAGWSTPWNQ
jgi:asparagine synthase (glutamine-hydrolysing)